MVSRIVIVGAVIAATLLWLAPSSVPDWAVIGFVLMILFPTAVVLTLKRMHVESRAARTLWLALTGKGRPFRFARRSNGAENRS
jgi:hypothetical protein